MSLKRYATASLTLGSTRLVHHDMTDALESLETIASVTVTDVTNDGSATGDLSITAVAVDSVGYTPPCSQTAVASNKAIQFSILTSSSTDKSYKLKIRCVTTGGIVVDYLYVSFSD
jgi:hypothetical protein